MSTEPSNDAISFPDHGDDDNLETELKEAQAQAPSQPEVPEKYRGKNLTDIIEMHRNAESELGRARNEVGTVRRLADELLGIRQSTAAGQSRMPEPRKKLTTDALFEDPDKAITEAVRADAMQRDAALAARTDRLEAEVMLTRFERKHPRFKETMESPEFVEWLQKSPYRARLAAGAAQGDFLAADELFSLHNEATADKAATVSKGKSSGAEGARQASLARPSGSSPRVQATDTSGKKIWKRTELIRMRIEDPEMFDSLYDKEILPAYREKRVK